MSSFNLTLSPAQIEYVLKPGITIIQAYEIINNSESSISLNTEVLPWIPTGTNGSVNYSQAVNNPGIQFSLNNADLQLGQFFTLAPGAKKQLVLKIKTDSALAFSDSYYTFFVSQNQQNTLNSDTSFTAATGKIGSHILLTFSNVENPKVSSEIKNFIISPKLKDVFFRPITIKGQIKNNSDFFFKTNGKIVITKNDQTIKEYTLNSDNVLSHHSRDISCSEENSCQLNPPLWPGSYKVIVTLDDNLDAKPYETSFYVWPISPVLFILLVIGIIFGVRKFRQKKDPDNKN